MKKSRIGVLATTGLVSLASISCNDHPLDRVRLERTTEDEGIVDVVQRKDVDILFVIDNSGSMGEEQATLAANFESFIAKLENPEVDANYRIAITTTNANHRHCVGGEDGKFQLSSCRAREGDFQRGGTVSQDDNFFDESCLSVCELPTLETIPTAALGDDALRPRPWIERIGGQTNLPEGVTTTQAFQCAGPQGVSGCGYESPLEGMRRAFTRAGTDGEPEFGFVRPGAILAVVFVTDEADCSARWKDIPDPWDADGMQTFWSEGNRNEAYPQSEVCWFAGVECEDLGNGLKACVSAEKDAAGEPADDDESVLFPVSRYTEFLQAIEDEKRDIDARAGLASADVLVAVIAGVPPGYESGDDIPYRDGLVPQDVAFQALNGIAPGCRTTGVGEAVPPVRLKEFADAFQTESPGGNGPSTNLFSVCEPDYSPALEDIAKLIADQVRPACVPACVEDTDPTTEVIEHNCVVTEVVPRGFEFAETTVPPCEIEGQNATVPAGADLCYVSLSDQNESTDVVFDDLEAACAGEGWNLQLKIVRTDNVREEPGASIRAKCSTSTRKSIDCPGL